MKEEKIELDGKTAVLRADPPTVDIKSRAANAENSGNIVLNPPPSNMGAK